MLHTYYHFEVGASRQPSDRVFEEFLDMTMYYPESLVGAAAIGAAGLAMPSLEDFANARMDPLRLVMAVGHTTDVHNQEIAERDNPRLRYIDNSRLLHLLPIISSLGIGSVFSSIDQLAQARAGLQLEGYRPVTVDDSLFRRVNRFLGHPDNHAIVSNLLTAATDALRAPEGPIHDLSEDYKAWLFRQPNSQSPYFPADEKALHATTQAKKELLAAAIRPLLRDELRPVAGQHRLNAHELLVFTHNITRP